MKAYYSDTFFLPLPEGHRFPMQKYRWLRERIAGQLADIQITESIAATDEQLALAHTREYIRRVTLGALTEAEQREIGFPWSMQMATRSRHSVGATIQACRSAMSEGVAANLAGGTHHAYSDKGSGFCVFNDIAVAARCLQAEHSFEATTFPIAIVDLDVHQGNGTAHIFAGDPAVFTLSLHGAKNFPFRKEISDLDVEFTDGAGDDEYLDRLNKALDVLWKNMQPGLVIYLAGMDVHCNDRLGRLKLSDDGIAQRDRMVYERTIRAGIPVAIVMAGGYGRDLSKMVDLQVSTIALASKYASQWKDKARRNAA